MCAAEATATATAMTVGEPASAPALNLFGPSDRVFLVTKIHVWRGRYPRLLILRAGSTVTTWTADGLRTTNGWPCDALSGVDVRKRGKELQITLYLNTESWIGIPQIEALHFSVSAQSKETRQLCSALNHMLLRTRPTVAASAPSALPVEVQEVRATVECNQMVDSAIRAAAEAVAAAVVISEEAAQLPAPAHAATAEPSSGSVAATAEIMEEVMEETAEVDLIMQETAEVTAADEAFLAEVASPHAPKRTPEQQRTNERRLSHSRTLSDPHAGALTPLLPMSPAGAPPPSTPVVMEALAELRGGGEAQATVKQLHQQLMQLNGFGKVALPTVRKAASKLTKRDAKAPSVPGAINDDDGDSEKENDNEVAIDTWTAAAAAVWNRW